MGRKSHKDATTNDKGMNGGRYVLLINVLLTTIDVIYYATLHHIRIVRISEN